MSDFFLATGNKHKIKEVLSLTPEINWKTITDFPKLKKFSPKETGKTFAENAEIKARAFAKKTGKITVAEDSGLSVQALDGSPGVHSARWVKGSDSKRNTALLKKLDGYNNKRAKYVATICLYVPDIDEVSSIKGLKKDSVTFFSGEVHGFIAMEPKGDKGFGYDPIFIPNGYEKTFGELGDKVKQKISHRRDAFEKFVKFLESDK
ncbi:MAG: RdgB/HAM1 family non-canonical purine NTP pyrophosphatase [Candidatus Pacebacteria bacterium]|jgi:non-canonical purine NTP pyrophosphatase (RdgB/HAM1 family)|nr:RdgB/HAM1 family non-canonical purine NTP pyrophosphatase [Candidatus Paceibacterota bacterium]MBT4651936.1 RdgB/HAM1 family non-canonical purine NTP pyrophosphatase [Candidatus Paceibacterota bacterium]MBT6755958.1 RdgB/HAM1 family non-canonical purine NTP pyrophosphatase [Candidatus Paceibacterota bacterium]MBT6920849.1 RdgB/HAM1 family non-canonical purine NTP pyrophosphatase [Candidatus Paceibacterota bacterium]